MTPVARLAQIAAIAIVVAVAILLVGWIFRPASGPLAIAGIVAAHLALATLALTPLAVARGTAPLRWALVLVLIVGVARFGDEWVSVPGPLDGASRFRVATWNLEYGAVGIDTMRAGLATLDAEVVALVELTLEQAEAIERDPAVTARFPHRGLMPRDGVFGIGLLSRSPLREVHVATDPTRIEASVGIHDAEITVVSAHPLPARIETVTPLRFPVGFDPTDRDGALARVRERVDELLAARRHVVVLGDFNVAPTEPAYDALTAGLRDAHREAGFGPGWTWRPSRLEALPMGLLRIDLVLTSGSLRPIAAGTDCSRPGDHCLTWAELTIESGR